MIELDHVSKHYGRIAAVDDLSLRVEKGEIFGFIGPNGAGKTTTIRMIGGILKPSTGRIRINGVDMQQNPTAAKRSIGFIPDRPYLYEKLSGSEFLRFIADLYQVDRRSADARAQELLAMFTLTDWAHELIESYSHGMKQRLVMAAALLHDPAIVVVDEPLVGLDPLGIKLVKGLFRKLAAGGVTMFVSTHTLPVAEDICHRIGIINRGRLIATGSPADLKQELKVVDADLEQIFLRLTRDA